ncbi:hypothetical protein JHK86_055051 [Glycine max]|nr:hypothetical protein JHK86_055051 [Glycine max]
MLKRKDVPQSISGRDDLHKHDLHNVVAVMEAQASLRQRRTQAEGERRRMIGFKRAGWTIFLEKFSNLRYCPYALFWGTNRPDKVSIRGCVNRKEVIIFSKTITAASDCLEENPVSFD